MADRELLGVATTAKIGGHPLHPMLIPFPIALLVTTFVCDIVYWASAQPFWANAALWSLLGAIVMAGAAAVAGLTDFFGNARIRAIGDAWQHMIGNVLAVVLALISLWLRFYYGAEQGALPWGIVLSTLTVLILLYTGWKGGTLVYYWRIGMQPEAPAEERRHS